MLRIRLRPFGLLAALFVFVSGLCAWGQGAPIVEEPGYTPTLTFDIVSIRQAPPPDANFHVSVTSPPRSSRFEATNLPMKAMVQIAYGFDAPVVGMPDWAEHTFWNIQARSDEAADARLAKLTPNEVRLEKRNAIRVMLKERLGLETHMETRNAQVYHLVVAKGGPKLQEAAPPKPQEDGSPAPFPPADVQAHGSQHGLEFVGTNSPIRAIAGALSSMVRAPVVDKTGLTGMYNYTLQFGQEWSAHDPDSWPSIFTAVQEQMGLKLESVHEDVPNLVVDHINKPTEN
jgi:uncharacterized protein (TIGR03435 family)